MDTPCSDHSESANPSSSHDPDTEQQATKSTEDKTEKMLHTKKRKKVKHVSFSKDSKQFDGMVPVNRLYDTILHNFFNVPDDRYGPIENLNTVDDYKLLTEVRELVKDLIERASSLGLEGTVPVLKTGGGKNNKIGRNHVVFVRRMVITKIDEKLASMEESLVINQQSDPDSS